jgi:hypothetical protein
VTARRAVLRADADAAVRRAAAAIRERGVRLYPGKDGLDSLSCALASPVARACCDALEQYAEACKNDGDPRTKQQRMADCLADLVLRPGETGLPPVQAQLTVTAPAATLAGGDEPGEVDGEPLPAAVIRAIAHALGLLPRPTGETAAEPDSEPTAGARARARVPAEAPAVADDDEARDACATAETVPAAGAAGTASGGTSERDDDRQRAALADLLLTNRIAGTALTGRPQVAVTHPLTGALLALTDAPAIRRGDPIGPPGETLAYRPEAALARFVRARDRRCRFPGCRARPRKCDLDHQIPYDRGGRTTHCNLCCLCEHHHRLSHQAPGWSMTPMPDGGIRWTLPGGHQVTTHPPAYGTDDDQPPDPSRPTAAASANADDPPPFRRGALLTWTAARLRRHPTAAHPPGQPAGSSARSRP